MRFFSQKQTNKCNLRCLSVLIMKKHYAGRDRSLKMTKSFFTADILTCHCMKSTGVTIHRAKAQFCSSIPVSCNRVTAIRHVRHQTLETEVAKWVSAIINYLQ